MKRHTLKATALAAAIAGLGFMGTLDAPAKPARHGVITTTQPDGTELSIVMQGDEFSRVVTTADGYLLATDDEGYYRYAAGVADGLPVPSTFRATNPAMRSAESMAFLSRLDREGLVATARAEATMSARAVQDRRVPALLQEQQTRGIGLFDYSFPVKGVQKVLVVLVEFADVSFNVSNPANYFSRMLNEKGFSTNGATGSARDWFLDNSTNQFLPDFDVYGPVKVPENMAYYGKNVGGIDANPEQMVIDACKLLDGTVNFADYDRDKDGYVDNVYIYYAGYGEADSGKANTIWPHSYNLLSSNKNPLKLDGVVIDRYACSNETDFLTNKPDGIGTFVHEFSHVMGLPDLYCTNYSTAFTPGEWSVLDYGPYNNGGKTPPNYSIFERNALGWMKPELLNSTRSVSVQPITTNTGYVVYTNKESEFYLFENRQQEGWDKYIPGHGMLVWHIDYVASAWIDNTVNNTKSHQYVDLVEADDIKSEGSRDGDSFPGADNITKFTPTSNPRFISWDRNDVGLEFTNIKESGKVVTFDCTLIGTPGTNAVESVEADAAFAVTLCGNVLSVSGSVDTVRLYDSLGRCVASMGANGSVALPARGLYIATDGKTSCKIMY